MLYLGVQVWVLNLMLLEDQALQWHAQGLTQEALINHCKTEPVILN